LRVFRSAEASRTRPGVGQPLHTSAVRSEKCRRLRGRAWMRMRVIVMFFGPCAPRALTSDLSVLSYNFKRLERFTKLATSSMSTCIDRLLLGEMWIDAHCRCSLSKVSYHGASLFMLQTFAYSLGLALAPACFNLDLLPVLVARHHAQHCSCLLSHDRRLLLYYSVGDTIGHGHHRPRVVAQRVMRMGRHRLWRLTKGQDL
jgi:hypothetical protein